MVRLARDTLAFASISGFVWMVCAAATLLGGGRLS